MDFTQQTIWFIVILLMSAPISYFSYQRVAGFKNERAAQANLIRITVSLLVILYIVLKPLQSWSPTWQLITAISGLVVMVYVSEGVLKKWVNHKKIV